MAKKNYPTKAFVAKLARLTDENEHGECYAAVADWCVKHSSGDDKAVFERLEEAFNNINEYHAHAGSIHHNVYVARYYIGKVMDNLIVRVFGEDVLGEINKGR